MFTACAACVYCFVSVPSSLLYIILILGSTGNHAGLIHRETRNTKAYNTHESTEWNSTANLLSQDGKFIQKNASAFWIPISQMGEEESVKAFCKLLRSD